MENASILEQYIDNGGEIRKYPLKHYNPASKYQKDPVLISLKKLLLLPLSPKDREEVERYIAVRKQILRVI